MNFVSERGDHRHFAMGFALIALALFAVLALAGRARAAETIYWDNYGFDPDNVGFANIDGSGGGTLNIGGQAIEGPEGMAYDTVTNRLFVANETGTTGQILAINLDGSGAVPFTPPGAPIEEPEGVAVDPVSRMIYWANVEGEGTIVWAKLDGTAGGILNTSGTTVAGPCCRVAIDPTGGRVYWINTKPTPNTINFANLNNTGGGGQLNLTGSTIEPGDEAIAVDSAGGRVYFTGGSNKIGFANVNGSGGGDVTTGTGVLNGPWGLAFDPTISTLYWGNESNGKEVRANALGFVNLSGAGGGISPVSAPVANPQDPVIIKIPAGAGAPTVSREAKNRANLSCSQGSWGADFPGGFVYRAPRTFAYQWSLNGKAVAGATAATFTAKSGGSYTCAVTATNQAGSASQTSGALSEKAAKVKLTTKRKAKTKPGKTVTFKVNAINQGDVQSKNAKVCVKLPKKAKSALKAPKCKSLGKLKGTAKKKVKLKFKVKPTAGGTYKVTFQVKGSPGKAAKAKIIVR